MVNSALIIITSVIKFKMFENYFPEFFNRLTLPTQKIPREGDSHYPPKNLFQHNI